MPKFSTLSAAVIGGVLLASMSVVAQYSRRTG
jgi:hypothetical protein